MRVVQSVTTGICLLGTGLVLTGCEQKQERSVAKSDAQQKVTSPAPGSFGSASRNEAAPAQIEANKRVDYKHALAEAPAPAGTAHGRANDAEEMKMAAKTKMESSRAGGSFGGRQVGQQNPNLYLANTYMGGSGTRDRIESLLQQGIFVDGKQIRLDAFSRNYAQAFPIPSETAMTVTADTERTKIVMQGDRTFLQVGLQAMKGETPHRAPLNITLALDRSGSMQAEDKMAHALTAAKRLVERLNPEDRFGLVAFDGSTQVIIPSQAVTNRAHLKALIETIRPGGGTNIYDGLQMAYQENQKQREASGVNLVILLSDGEVTSGINDPRAFQQLVRENVSRDIQTTSVGVGTTFNEELMLNVARDGQGNYHFLKDGADTQTVFAKELDELSHIVAKAVKLRIRLAQGVGLVRALGAATLDADQTARVKAEEKAIDRKVAAELGITANRQNVPDEPGIKLLIPNFHRGDSHVVMLEISVPPGTGTRKIADVFLKYKDLAFRANRETTAQATMQYTADKTEAIASLNRSVKKNLLGFQTGEALMQAATLIQQGQAAEAVRRVQERGAVLEYAAKQWNDADLARDSKLLDRYRTVLAQMDSGRSLASSDVGQYLSRSLTYAGYKLTR